MCVCVWSLCVYGVCECVFVVNVCVCVCMGCVCVYSRCVCVCVCMASVCVRSTLAAYGVRKRARSVPLSPVHCLLRSAFNTVGIEKEKIKQILSDQEQSSQAAQINTLRKSLSQVNTHTAFQRRRPKTLFNTPAVSEQKTKRCLFPFLGIQVSCKW